LVYFFLFWMLIEFGIWYIFFHFRMLNHFIEKLDTK
jgi:hypothetical protein